MGGERDGTNKSVEGLFRGIVGMTFRKPFETFRPFHVLH